MDADNSCSEETKMMGTTDSRSHGKKITSHPDIPIFKEDGILLMQREEHKDQVPGRSCQFQEDDNKICGSEDKYVGSFICSNDTCYCQPSLEPNEKTSAAGDSKSVKTEKSYQDDNTGKKCRFLKRVAQQNRIHICLSISFMGNIGLIVTVALLATKIGKNIESEEEKCPMQQLPQEVFKNSVCIPCDYLGSTVKEEDTLFGIISSCGYKFCCVKNATLQKLFLLMLTEGHINQATTMQLDLDVNKTLSSWRSRNIAAHLYENVTSLPGKLTWHTNVGYGSAFMQGITLTPESRIQMPRAGFYYIYSAVTFTCQPGSTLFIHQINRQHRGRPNAGVQQLLLRKSNECRPDGFYTSFLAGVLKLTSNDEISVNLTENSLSSVYASSLANYFGIFLI